MFRKRVLGAVAAIVAIAALTTGGAGLATTLKSGSTASRSPVSKTAAKQLFNKRLAQKQAHRVSLTSRPAAVRYLRSRGFDPRAFVFQFGRRNYAGPACPGRGWNCTRSRRVVQLGDENQTQCKGPGASTPSVPPGQNCVIVQGSADSTGDNKAECIERSHSPTAVQSCDITQTTATGQNRAIVHQSIENEQNKDGSAQDGSQDIRIKQANASGDNHADWDQRIKFGAHDNKGGGTQDQDGHSQAIVTQTAMPALVGTQLVPGTGNSFSNGDQDHALRAKAHKGVIDQNQDQKTSPFGDCHVDFSTIAAARLSDPTQCAFIDQLSVTGRLESSVDQNNHLDADAKSNEAITQRQGTIHNGLDVGQDQDSLGVAHNDNHALEDFDADGKTGPGLWTLIQHGPVGGNGSPMPQCCNLDDTALFDQVSRLHAHNPDPDDVIVQTSEGGISYETTGNATASQDFMTNDGRFQQTHSGNVVFEETTCGDIVIPDGSALQPQQETPPCFGTGTGGPPPTTSTIPVG